MTEIIARFFVDVRLSKSKLTVFLHGNCFILASTVTEYSLWEMLLRVLAKAAPAHCETYYMTAVA